MPMHAPNFFLAVLAAVFAAVGGLWAESGRPLHAQEPPPPWQSTEQRDHPLAGRIWRARDGAFVTPAELARALDAAPAQALDVAQSLDPADHLSAQTLQAVGLWGGMLRHGLTAPGGADLLNRLYHE